MAPSVLASAGLIPQTPEEVTWFKTGVIPPAGTYEEGYWADPYTLFFLEVIAFQFAELRRWQDYRKPGSMSKQWFLGIEDVFKGSGDPAYPGINRQHPRMFLSFFGCLTVKMGSSAIPLWQQLEAMLLMQCLLIG